MAESIDALPAPTNLAAEFYLWFWWQSEANGAHFVLPDPVGALDAWVDERLSFRHPGETKVTAVLTGDDASTTLEARAALAGGKVLEEIRVHIRRDEHEFTVTLKGALAAIQQARLPQVVHEAEDTALYDRMFLYEELHLIVGTLFQIFSAARVDASWERDTLPAIDAWVHGATA